MPEKPDESKAYRKLEKKADQLESSTLKEMEVSYPNLGWDARVHVAMIKGEKKIRQMIEELRPYLKNPERILQVELGAYRTEIVRIRRDLNRMKHQSEVERKIDAVVQDILDDFERPKRIKAIELQACMKRMEFNRDRAPLSFIKNFNIYENLPEAPQNLSLAIHALIQHGDMHYVQEALISVRSFTEQNNSLMQEPSVQKALAEAVRALIEFYDPSFYVASLPAFPVEIYEWLAPNTWFEASLREGFSILLREEEHFKNALAFIASFSSIPDFLEQPFIHDAILPLATTISATDPAIALEVSFLYKHLEGGDTILRTAVYTLAEQKRFSVLVLSVGDYQGLFTEQELQALIPYEETYVLVLEPFFLDGLFKDFKKWSSEAPDWLVFHVLIVAMEKKPDVLLKEYPSYQEYDGAKGLWRLALGNAISQMPGVVLELFAEEEVQNMPFENREESLLEAVKRAARYNPHDAVTFQEVYAFLPEAAALLAQAQQRRLIVDAIGFSDYPNSREAETKLFNDPGLRFIDFIKRAWFPMDLTDTELGEAMAMVSRNVYLQGKTLMDEETCRAAYIDILELREQYKNLPLLNKRNVLLASHNEHFSMGEDRFGNVDFVEALKKEQGEGKIFEHYEAPTKTLEDLQRTKEDILKSVSTMPGPMTFIFHGHGGRDVLYLSDGQLEGLAEGEQGIIETENTVKITVKELAEVISLRGEKLGRETVQHDIFWFNGCYNHTFLRGLYQELDVLKAASPITLGYGEYDQTVIGLGTFNLHFFSDLLLKAAEKPGKKITLSDIWNLDPAWWRRGLYSPSLYIPSAAGTPQEVAETEEQEKSEEKLS